MISSYLRIAWRNLIRNKSFSAINIPGLAAGITCSLLIMLWINDELKVDAFHKNGDQLYQVYQRRFFDGKIEAGYQTPGLLAEELKKAIPEIRYATALEYAAPPGTPNTFEAGDEIGKMQGQYAASDFFSMFTFPLLAGDARSALASPVSIAISQKMAEYFFGSAENAMGRTIRFDNKEDLQVSAVFENPPAHASLQFDFLRSWSAFKKQNAWIVNWSNTSPSTMILINQNAQPEKVEAKIRDFVSRFLREPEGNKTELALQSYPEKYLHSSFDNGYISGGRIEYVRLFTVVAVLILLIACINFMNLATAQSAKRAKEVGLRKVIGAGRSSLVTQFMLETLMLTMFAVLLAVVLSGILLPAFNDLTGKQLSIPVREPGFYAVLLLLAMVTGAVAGSYPAAFLSSLAPVKIFKGKLKFGMGAVLFRKGLVVFQFTVSIILILGMMVIYKQMDYVQSRNLGYDRKNLLYIPIEGELEKNYQLFKQSALNNPGILSISKMRNSPTIIEHHTGNISWKGKDPNQVVSFADAVVGYDFVKTMNLTVTQGRDFSREFGTDSTGFLLNETAVRKIGLKDPVGAAISWGNREGEVIGVLKDFHFNSLHQPIDPLIVRLDDNWTWGTIMIRTEAGKIRQAIAALESISKKLNPKVPFTYQFSDAEYAKLYRSEEVVSKLSEYFAVLAIFISCLGLFGLASFTAAQRTKEIGVRKVLGATAPDILGMLSGKFLQLIGIALLVAFPVAWLIMKQWLENFAYQVEMEWWMFAIAAMVTICIAMVTVSYESIKAAMMNPVKTLRRE